ncbi:MAG: cell division protein ZapE, partial [Alphaproteobacteria bacterium]|nr:cell division protein ZapE [Alphaproteobacteria bacterium]
MNLAALYHKKTTAGELRPDPAQEAAIPVLQAFADGLNGYRPPARGLWRRFFADAPRPAGPQGLYLYGDVGRGKSMLMDLFFAEAPVEKKRRVHFHQFMLEIHARLNRLQQEEAPGVLPRVGREIAAETWLLCFDEF